MSAMRPTHWDRLEAQAERALKALEEQGEPASVKDLNGIYRLLDRLRRDRHFEEIRNLTRDDARGPD